ncbi:hypothetical protein I6F09_04890 [Bradyrhizobium sp. IC3195]|uniref:hypothetical protein n=1 Tax=Bradyrhizobium sp. IC3195 TaxID=2793804 RepID=UPI001CD535CF|nr:hypothetical protein [Bradyrhizobium sp. IC3195]MCA1467223.1 hypothetical protein [Bradyrhizobium sp. IC3195]
MKANALNSLLEECRSSKTSDDLGTAVRKVDEMAASVRAERAKLDGQLQETILAGRDTGKIHGTIADLDQQLRDLEAAQTGFSQRRDEMAKQETEAARAALKERLALETDQVADIGRRIRAAADVLLELTAEGEKLVRQHDRTVGELESLGERRLERAATVLRENIGQPPAPSGKMGLSEYGRQVFTLVSQILKLSPSYLLRGRLTRRQNGRLGESFAAKDHATEALMDQVRSVRSAGDR